MTRMSIRTGQGGTRAGAALWLAVACLVAAPAAAQAETSYGDMMPVLLAKTVRDTETGARARITYVNEVMTGGMEIFVDEDGQERQLHWDGWKGVFEVDFAIAGGVMAPDVPAFVREAVRSVCPSVDGAALEQSPVRRLTGTLYQLDAQCPALDGR